MTLSVVVCTYNRCGIMMDCLVSLNRQQPVDEDWEVIVVDNNSTDETEAYAKQYLTPSDVTPMTRGRYILEEKVGLSHARNTGFREASGDWVLYLDDDAKARPDLIKNTIAACQNGDFAAIGGRFEPWYKYDKPPWYRDEYATFNLGYDRLTQISDDETLIGAIMCWRRDVLEELGGFDPRLGMRGGKVGYGEEDFLQELARERGYRIGFTPEMVVDHLVLPHKLRFEWFFAAHYALGEDFAAGTERERGTSSILKHLAIGLLVAGKDALINTPKLLGSDYYLENWCIDVLRKPAKRLGAIRAILRKRWS